MSQNGTPPTTDENRAPTTSTIHAPLLVPMMPMFFPYGNVNPAGQQYFAPAVYPNVPTYPSTANQRHANYGLGYNAYYAPFYHTPTNLLPPARHITNASALPLPRPLIMPPRLPLSQQQNSSIGSSTNGNETERNKNLNIRECHSPVTKQTENEKREKKPLQIIDPNDINAQLELHEDSSTASSPISQSESDQNLVPRLSTALIQEIDSDTPQDDFLTFIEQKTKTSTTMPELNPFANEFSFVHNQTLTKDSSITTNGINHHADNDNQSSYRLLFDNLIEKSLESIEAIKKSTKKLSTKDISVQCTPSNVVINRSTQTTSDQSNNQKFIEEYSSRTVKLMDKLLNDFRNIYQADFHDQCKAMAHTCDELRHLIVFIHHLATPASSEQQKQLLLDLNTPFNDVIQDLANDTTIINRYQESPQTVHSVGRGIRRSMTSTTTASLPSFSCRQIDPIVVIPTPKLCLLCQRPVEDSDDVMHKLCRSLSYHPHMSSDT